MAKKATAGKAAARKAVPAVPPPATAAQRAGILAELLASAPAGWKTASGLGYFDMDGETWTKERGVWASFSRAEGDLRVCIGLNVDEVRADDTYALQHNAFRGARVEGHTRFNGRTFTRRGIDVESCALRDVAIYDHNYVTLADLLAGEWERCKAAHARTKTAVPVPGLPFERQPEWFTETAAKLRAGQPVNLAPAGMGTGYTLSRRPTRYGRRADAALEAKLGVGAVYVETFDHD
jgi:hypothetical protein